MSEGQQNLSRQSKRHYSVEEKQHYCMSWKKSGASQVEFCRKNGISRSSFYKWIKEFKTETEEDTSCFSPVVLEEYAVNQADLISLKISLPTKIHLKLTLPKNCLASFIKDIGYETTIIR